MGQRKPKRIRAMAPEALAAREDQQLREAVNDVADQISLPKAQRGHHAVEIVPAEKDGWKDAHKRTVRKLTRVERLERSGAIEPAHVKAITLYVDAAELAYATGARISGYGEGGGSSPTGAAAAEHERQWDKAWTGLRYQRARDCLPRPYVTAFERIVLDNHPIGTVGREMWPASSVGAVSGAVREMVRTCAESLCIEFASELGLDAKRPSLLRTMQRMDAAVRAQQSGSPISDAIAMRLATADAGDALFVSPAVRDDMLREAGLDDAPDTWFGHTLVVVDHWQFGWLVQPAD